MRCKTCRARAAVEIRRHNAAYCKECFFEYCERQVRRAIDEFHMVEPQDRVLVAVSGGKDSLALWDLLVRLGYQAEGLYLDLGIGRYSSESETKASAFADSRGLKLHTVSLRETYGFGIPDGSSVGTRPTCSLCGMSKRHVLNAYAYDHGYDVLGTGHNLDDEAATLLSNLVRWETEYLARQWPVLPARDGFVKKVKPLIRLGERETASYCFLSGIDYVVEECPLVGGNTQLVYKEALDVLERRSPGTKAALVSGFLGKKGARIRDAILSQSLGPEGEEGSPLVRCSRCGSPTPHRVAGSESADGDESTAEAHPSEKGAVCAFCRETAKIGLRLRAKEKSRVC